MVPCESIDIIDISVCSMLSDQDHYGDSEELEQYGRGICSPDICHQGHPVTAN
jgi:hypothetical protein